MLHESLYHLKPTIMCHCFAWRVFVLIILRFSFYVTSFRPKNNLILIYPTTATFEIFSEILCKVNEINKNYIIRINQCILSKQDLVFDELSRANFTLNLLSPLRLFPKNATRFVQANEDYINTFHYRCI